MLNRVVITGFGNVCAFGRDWASIKQNLAQQKSAVVYMSEWDIFGEELNTRLGAPIPNYAPPAHWNRKDTRSMGKVAMFGVDAAGEALADAGLLEDERIKDGRMGVAAGSCSGDAKATGEVIDILHGKDSTLNANSYVKMMPHTVAANIAIYYGLKGRLIPTGSACTSASQAIGYSYEAIKFGLIDMMLAGGADELHPSQAFVFDKLYATSCKNDTPTLSPAPFDIARDGLVLGEGGAIFVLESLRSALTRDAKIYAEIVGFGTTCDGTHITRPQSETMRVAMQLALKDAAISPDLIGHVNAHATATRQGDIAESMATHEIFGSQIPVSSYKGYLGHTLGACGALESFISVMMMNEGLFYPNLNLHDIDPQCAPLRYLTQPQEIKTDYVMNNNFAFGGVNTSLIFKKFIN